MKDALFPVCLKHREVRPTPGGCLP
jgi:hypothetical protein